MNISIDIMAILQGIILVLVAWGLKGITSINSRLRELNGNVRDLKAWKDVHQPAEEKWQDANAQAHKELRDEIKGIRENK